MKYGLVYFKGTGNLGDDILSYAGKRFLPRVDYYIDRENMDLFMPGEKEYVAAILNGWYIHFSYTFPPSPYLLPLFVGTHFNRDTTMFGDYSYLDGYAADYLKAFQPIGCRDKKTMEILMQRGIESYFSGCLTLTLQKYPGVACSHSIFLTDVPSEVAEYVERLYPGKSKVRLTHRLSPDETGWENWGKREERVESYLKSYQGAELVVTTRLHCALPCIALGTPVVLVVNKNDDYYERIECFSQYCPCFTSEEVLSGKADAALTGQAGMEKPDLLVNQMETAVKEFIKDIEQMERDTAMLHELSTYQELYIKRNQSNRRAVEVMWQRYRSLTQQYIKDMKQVEHIVALVEKLQTQQGMSAEL